MNNRKLPTEEEVLGYAESCSNWGRWGADDQLGTLNLVTDEKRRQAAGLVKDGTSVSCAWTISKDLPGETMSQVLHYMTETGEAGPDAEESGDFIGVWPTTATPSRMSTLSATSLPRAVCTTDSRPT